MYMYTHGCVKSNIKRIDNLNCVKQILIGDEIEMSLKEFFLIIKCLGRLG